ncbi:conserved hypothetical protein [Hahella chejuensis KCTC 2396]|uniref:Uncharacterized protein n=1 Tax=Hahella chejuensis (strain KCTC 2396) TaxID=349521 RepID=Q2SKK7_HAHCH|nr:hypothetical protein [Hahella chejuensis]ABC28817.1 conserved hypothetical protein [Hahella chejuensis KCTC 2396]
MTSFLAKSLLFSIGASAFAFGEEASIERLPDMLAKIQYVAKLTEACPDDYQSEYRNWRKLNRIDAIEAVVNVLLVDDAQLQVRLTDIARDAGGKAKLHRADYCVHLEQVLASPDFMPVLAFPELTQKLLDETPQEALTSEMERVAAQPLDPELIRQDMAQVETVMFNRRHLRIAGKSAVVDAPELLFKNGDLCMDASALVFRGGVARHKARRPAKWTRWRTNNGEREWLNGEKWEKFVSAKEFPPLQEDFRMENTLSFQEETDGGAFPIINVVRYQFSSDGKFTRNLDSYPSQDVPLNNASVSFYYPKQEGRYEIDGYLLTLHFDDGETLYKTIVLDKNSSSPVWLNGDEYVE